MSQSTDDARQAFAFFTNFEGQPNQTEAYSGKIRQLTTAPTNLVKFLYTFRDYLNGAAAVEPKLTQPFAITIEKQLLLQAARYFETKGRCQTLKICFGIDLDFTPKLIISGSFAVPVGENISIKHLDRMYLASSQTTTDSSPGLVYYKLNFGRRISARAANQFTGGFQLFTPKAILHGYLIDIATFRKFFTESDYLGESTSIQISFGMNNDGCSADIDPTITSVQHMMLAFQDAVSPSVTRAFYMCSSAIKDDTDSTDCPPRDPCNTATVSKTN